MGSTLPKEVDSTVVERHEKMGFRVGTCEMNGWRQNMEDAHLIHIRGDWGFFGVFDGHGGDQCAKFVAPCMEKKLQDAGCPADDEAVRKMLFEVDQAWLDQGEDSGATATMCIVHKPAPGAKHNLRVINAGDSRVLLGRHDGSIVDGGGTDKGLTTDHKPDHPDEKERIEVAGGTVEIAMGGVSRVNGVLAVSRGFGDREYKQNREGKPEDQIVTVNPDLKRIECSDSDFILLVCDGVSEGDFSNEQVVKLVSEVLQESNDPGKAARAVCHQAVARNSKDNISCVVVTLDGTKDSEKKVEFRPGAVDKLGTDSYFKAYEAMAERADLTIADAVAMRYDMLSDILSKKLDLSAQDVKDRLGSCEEVQPGVVDFSNFQNELRYMESNGTPPSGSAERKQFFEEWVDNR